MYQVVDKTGKSGFSSCYLRDATYWAAMVAERQNIPSQVKYDGTMKCAFAIDGEGEGYTFAEVEEMKRVKLPPELERLIETIEQARQEIIAFGIDCGEKWRKALGNLDTEIQIICGPQEPKPEPCGRWEQHRRGK